MRLFEINEQDMQNQKVVVEVSTVEEINEPIYYSAQEVTIGEDIPKVRAEFVDAKTGQKVRFKETKGSTVLLPPDAIEKGDRFVTVRNYTYYSVPKELKEKMQELIDLARNQNQKKRDNAAERRRKAEEPKPKPKIKYKYVTRRG